MPKRKIESEEENNSQITTDSTVENTDSGEDLFNEDMLADYQEKPGQDEYDPEDVTSESVEEEHFLYDRSSSPTPGININENDLGEVDIRDRMIAFLNKRTKDIKAMCSANEESLYVSYMDIEKESMHLNMLIEDTERFMHIFDDSLEHVVKLIFPNYRYIKKKVHIRIRDVPLVETIRSLRNVHIGTLVKIRGVITRRSNVYPLLSIVMYHCNKCGSSFGPLVHESETVKICIACQSKGPHSINTSETIYKDLQKVTVQEVPGTVPSGRLPRQKEVHLFYDLIDSVKPGEEVEITGVYKNTFSYALNLKNGFPVFSTIIEAITVEKKEEEISIVSDIKEITKLSKNPRIKNIILNSIAPYIYGHGNIKKAIALSMFGGQRKESDGHNIRGDINVLLLGDPGTAKSQFLRYVEATSHRAVLASGQGASSVGLTASVRKDPITKEWTLEGGALVLADKGVCLIDEFDKMDDIDRVSIHEAMEQQSISISKAGIVASLRARCSVIAAANPRRGRYNSSLTFAQNVNLTDPIISRFDILCVIRDVIGGEDEIMGEFIVDSHRNVLKRQQLYEQRLQEGEANNNDERVDEDVNDIYMKDFSGVMIDKYGKEVISQKMLKKYITYARKNCFPVLNEIDKDKISKLYSDLRKESMSSGSIPITARHIESIVRMSESFARMKLRDLVDQSDIDSAIEVALDSFINAQKYSVTKVLRKKFSKYLSTGSEVLLYVLNEIFNEKIKATGNRGNIDDSLETVSSISCKDFESRVLSVGLKFKKEFYVSEEFKRCGYIHEKERITRNT